MKIHCTTRGLACIGVTLAAVVQAAREPAGPSLPLLALGLVLLVALILRAEWARRMLTALGFLFCAVASARCLVRVAAPFSSDTVCYVAPAVLLLCAAMGVHIAMRTRHRQSISSSLPIAAAACGIAGVFGYLCLSRMYSLETAVLRSLVLNCALAFSAWTLMTDTKPGKGLSSIVCAGLLMSDGMPLS